MTALSIAWFTAAYDRTGTITVTLATCDVCKAQNLPVIRIDSSEDEYGPGNICKSCALNAFEQWAVESFRS